MKTVKIIFGFLILYAVGSEYANASRQLVSFFSPGILLVVFFTLFLSAWLIGSGFSKEKMKIKSVQFLKYFGVSFLVFGLVAMMSFASYKAPREIVEFNGIKIPIGDFMEGNRRIVPNQKERKAYCSCVVEKLANSKEISNDYRLELESGKIGKIITEINSQDSFIDLELETCLRSTEIKWTDNLINSMKKGWKSELVNTEFEQTNDIDEYCDCLVNEYQKHPFSLIAKDEFIESKLSFGIDSLCTEKSKK